MTLIIIIIIILQLVFFTSLKLSAWFGAFVWYTGLAVGGKLYAKWANRINAWEKKERAKRTQENKSTFHTFPYL